MVLVESCEQSVAEVQQLEKHIRILRASNEGKSTQILHLRAIVNREKTLSTFTTFGKVDQKSIASYAPEDCDINRTIDHVDYRIRDAVLKIPFDAERLDLNAFFETQTKEPELVCFLCSCFGVKPEHVARFATEMQKLQFPMHDILRLALWTAIKDWVFYFDLMNLKGEFSLLDSLNQCIHDRGKETKNLK